jgi:hypothetical protein
MIDTNAIRAAIQRRRFSAPMKAALLAVLDGESYRNAAEIHGARWRDLHRAAATVPGLREAHLRAWRASWGDSFPEVWQRHIEGIGSGDEPR